MSTPVKLDVRVYPLNDPKNITLAYANVGIADSVAVSGIRLVKSKANGEDFVSMPQYKDRDGNYRTIASIENSKLRAELKKAVAAEFKNQTRDAEGKYVGASVTVQADGVTPGTLKVTAHPAKDNGGSVLAYANVTVDGIVSINSVRVVDSAGGPFISMPQSRDKSGNYHDVAFPINADLRRAITDKVLEAYGGREKGRGMDERLAEGKEQSERHNAERRDARAQPKASKGSPGLGD
jgi:stage V sporulation protein G